MNKIYLLIIFCISCSPINIINYSPAYLNSDGDRNYFLVYITKKPQMVKDLNLKNNKSRLAKLEVNIIEHFVTEKTFNLSRAIAMSMFISGDNPIDTSSYKSSYFKDSIIQVHCADISSRNYNRLVNCFKYGNLLMLEEIYQKGGVTFTFDIYNYKPEFLDSLIIMKYYKPL